MFKPLFTSPIDDIIVRLLSIRTYRTTALHEAVLAETPLSRQSFYEALRRLTKSEVIVVNKKLVSLNKLWIERLITFTQETAHVYEESYRMESQYLELKPGERVSYVFKSLEALDMFVNHATLLIAERCDTQVPSVAYNTHHWFFAARQSSELAWWKVLGRLGINLFIANGGKSDADKQVGKYIQNLKSKHIRFSVTDTNLFKKNHFMNIYGNMLVEVKLEEGIGQEIDRWFRDTRDIFDEQAKEGLQKIVKRISKVKLIISNNPKRAEIIRKRIMKCFSV